MEENTNTITIRTRRWRCPNGHEWGESWNGPWPISFSLGHGLEIGPKCPFCLHQKLQELLADVPDAEEVGDDET